MNPEQDNILNVVQESPGQQLATERKKQGLAERDVANQLKITLSKLHAIEQDQYDKFPAQIYLKGYLKNYARLLRLPEQAVTDSYKTYVGDSFAEEEQYAPPPEPAKEPQNHKTWLYLLLVLAFIAVCFVVYTQFVSKPSPLVQASDAALIFESPDNVIALADDTGKTDIAQPLVDAGLPTADVEEKESFNPLVQAEKSQSVNINKEPVEILASKLTAAELISLTEPEIKEEPEIVDVVSLADVLGFRFANQCWIEVRDSTGSLLYSGLENAGSERKIEGEGPFNVVVGNVAGTVISLNGEGVSLPTPAQGRALRLQVGS